MTAVAHALPSTGVWAELRGQEQVVEQLRRAAQSGTPTHAWLFTGPPGSGRSNAARAFADKLHRIETLNVTPDLAAAISGALRPRTPPA